MLASKDCLYHSDRTDRCSLTAKGQWAERDRFRSPTAEPLNFPFRPTAFWPNQEKNVCVLRETTGSEMLTGFVFPADE